MKKVLLVAVAIVALWASPAAAQYGPDFTATLSASNVRPGSTVVVDGSCSAGGSVVVALGSRTLGSTTVGADGLYSVSITVPQLDRGSHTLRVSCGEQVRQLSFTVGAAGGATTPSPSTGSGALVRTGSDTGTLLRVGAVLLLAGAVLVVAVRRRGDAAVIA